MGSSIIFARYLPSLWSGNSVGFEMYTTLPFVYVTKMSLNRLLSDKHTLVRHCRRGDNDVRRVLILQSLSAAVSGAKSSSASKLTRRPCATCRGNPSGSLGSMQRTTLLRQSLEMSSRSTLQ